MIDTIEGLMEEKDLVCETVVFDGPDYYAFERRYSRHGTALNANELILARYHDVKWTKKNEFLNTPKVIFTSRGHMPTDQLEKKTGTVDNDKEFHCWVEYRPMGEDEIVHRSVHTKLKVPPTQLTASPGIL